MPATNTAAARFTFAPDTLVHVLGPWQMDLQGRGTDRWTGKTMVVVEHRVDGDVVVIDEAGNPSSVTWIYETRLIAD